MIAFEQAINIFFDVKRRGKGISKAGEILIDASDRLSKTSAVDFLVKSSLDYKRMSNCTTEEMIAHCISFSVVIGMIAGNASLEDIQDFAI